MENEAGHNRFARLVIDHIRRVHEHPWLKDANHGLIIESNYGGWPVSHMLYQKVRCAHPNVFGIHIPTRDEVRSGVPFSAQVGWMHNSDDTRFSALLFGKLLSEHKVRFIEDFIIDPVKAKEPEDARLELITQLGNLENLDPTEKEERTKKQISFSGKRSGCDDMIMMLICGSLLLRMFLTDPRQEKVFNGWSVMYFRDDEYTDEARQASHNALFSVIR